MFCRWLQLASAGCRHRALGSDGRCELFNPDFNFVLITCGVVETVHNLADSAEESHCSLAVFFRDLCVRTAMSPTFTTTRPLEGLTRSLVNMLASPPAAAFSGGNASADSRI